MASLIQSLPAFATMKIEANHVRTKIIVLIIVYVSFLMDNILLTVVVPIIPDYLFSHEATQNKTNLEGLVSLSPLQLKYESLDEDNGPLGALLASKAFVQLAFTPVVGYLTQIVGYNVPMLVGSYNMLIASILFAYGKSYGVLVLARALHGSSSAAIAVSGMCLLAEAIPKKERSHLMPLAFGGTALGVLIGYPLGGAAYQLMGKSAPFIFIAFFIFLNICLQHWYHDYKKSKSSQASRVDVVGWVSLLRDKDVLISTGSICFTTSCMAILEPTVPMWLLGHFQPPPSKWQLGAVFIPDSIGYFIGSHFTGLLPVKPWRIAIAAMVLSGLSCCALPLSSSLQQLVLPHFGIGLGVGAVDAALVPYLANLVDAYDNLHYGPIYAIQQASVSLAYAFGSLFGGEAIKSMGFPWLMRIVGFMNILYCPFLTELEHSDSRFEKMSLQLHNDGLPSYSTIDGSDSFDRSN